MAKIRSGAIRQDVETRREGEQPREGERLEAWMFFLRHGHLPWWFAAARWEEISSVRELHAADSVRMIVELAKLLDCPAALVRLARYASAEELAAVLEVEKPGAKLGKMGGSAGAVNVLRLWLGGLAGGAAVWERVFPMLSHAERAVVGAGENPAEHLVKIGPMGSISPMDSPKLATTSRSPESDLQEDALSGEAGLPVGTAGLVLLHPFLGRLFRQLGWLDETGGLLPDFRWEAVQALQFLALGRCGLPEATLVFEKTLCGIPLHEVAEFPALDDTVRAECEGLLEAMIEHWSVLGKTSVGGLREAFLERRGLLFFEEKRVRLAVERRSFDMLLGMLPWPLGMVMFGWLNRPIFVKWEGGES